ncbi:S8 family peptidase [Paenibacillus alkalitolerans]|uniref:S8 family peptidase n=1 Tax=Paenibacillus alkalitolerans TaxID=2799335 RepID=UPI001F21E9AE|nr:S8 family peptidase [Paenibacillus alkalitolerans]
MQMKKGTAINSKRRKSNLVRLIVQFKSKKHYRNHRSLKKLIHPKYYARHAPLKMIRSIAVKVPRRSYRSICRCTDVKRVFVDRKRRINLNVATPSVGASAAQRSGWTGRGVTIAVLDTGIYRHPDLTNPRNRIVAFKDFVNNRRRAYDDNGHGTHCAGDAAGNGFRSGGKYKGPAPEARLAGVKVLNRNGVGLDSTIIRGIEWCLNNRRRYGIRILSLSLGAKAVAPCSRDALCQAVNQAVRRGLVVVTSAGNGGPGIGTIDSPGTSPLAITVGAANDHRTVRTSDDTIPDFSGRGPARGGVSKPDLVAPGVSIISLRAPVSTLDRRFRRSRVGRSYFTLTGTSMAAPIAAGVAAQLLQKFPGSSPGRVKRLLRRNAVALRRSRNVQGSGLVNIRFL